MDTKRPFTDLDWTMTPDSVRRYILTLEQALDLVRQQVANNEKRIEKLEAQTQKNSRNSSKPPSSDSPFKRGDRKKKNKKNKRARGGQKGHKAHKQQILEPTRQHCLTPERCTCGNTDFAGCDMTPFYTHQQIELPKIEMEISHFVLHQCSCPKCGKAVKADLPGNAAVGYGPRLSAFVAELSGIKAMSLMFSTPNQRVRGNLMSRKIRRIIRSNILIRQVIK